MNKLLGRLFKQHQLGQLPGATKNVMSNTLVYVGYINFLLIVAIAYNTTFRDLLERYIPWLTFPMFVGVTIVIVGMAMLLEYKLMMPSAWHFQQKQLWQHQSPIRAELKRIQQKLEEIERKIDKRKRQ